MNVHTIFHIALVTLVLSIIYLVYPKKYDDTDDEFMTVGEEWREHTAQLVFILSGCVIAAYYLLKSVIPGIAS